jgi:hypothetical protein
MKLIIIVVAVVVVVWDAGENKMTRSSRIGGPENF